MIIEEYILFVSSLRKDKKFENRFSFSFSKLSLKKVKGRTAASHLIPSERKPIHREQQQDPESDSIQQPVGENPSNLIIISINQIDTCHTSIIYLKNIKIK